MRAEISDLSIQNPDRAALPRLVVTGLGCVRGGRKVFEDVAFEVGAGEALAVTGDNGAGKTSLLRLIAGLLHAEAGSIVLHGADADASLAEQAHYLGHRDALKPSLTVLENLGFWRNFLGGPEDRSDLREHLEALGLGHAADLPAAYLSAGQRRRLSFARLIAVKRPLWLLDEPLSALDVAGQKLVTGLMAEHLAHGGLIVAATHGPLGVEARELRVGAIA